MGDREQYWSPSVSGVPEALQKEKQRWYDIAAYKKKNRQRGSTLMRREKAKEQLPEGEQRPKEGPKREGSKGGGVEGGSG